MFKAITALAIASIALAAPAFANTTNMQRQIVRYGDLDLASDAGRAVLDTRLTRAARSVCGVNDATDLGSKMSASACYKRSISAARDNVANAMATPKTEG